MIVVMDGVADEDGNAGFFKIVQRNCNVQNWSEAHDERESRLATEKGLFNIINVTVTLL